jgi:hypothetical protein
MINLSKNQPMTFHQQLRSRARMDSKYQFEMRDITLRETLCGSAILILPAASLIAPRNKPTNGGKQLFGVGAGAGGSRSRTHYNHATIAKAADSV